MKARKRQGKRGFLAADVLAALALLIIAGAALMVAITRQRTGATRLAETREAGRLAEAALVDLQSGQALPKDTADTKLVIRPCQSGGAVGGHHWVEVEAAVRGQTRVLIGLAPDAASPTTRTSGENP